jgi:SAM-dependent methyltransferase
MKKLPLFLAEFYLLYKAVKLVYAKDSYLRKKGFPNSVRKKLPLDANGSAIPWMNYNIVDFLESRLNDEMDVFEFGCGYSTLFFQKRVKSVTSVESELKWHQKMSSIAHTNVKIIYCPVSDTNKDYADSITGTPDYYDMVLVDGRLRVCSIKNAITKLKPGGVIVLDDSHRPKYSEGIEFLISQGFKKIDFNGMKPVSVYSHQSTVFYKPENCFNI